MLPTVCTRYQGDLTNDVRYTVLKILCQSKVSLTNIVCITKNLCSIFSYRFFFFFKTLSCTIHSVKFNMCAKLWTLNCHAHTQHTWWYTNVNSKMSYHDFKMVLGYPYDYGLRTPGFQFEPGGNTYYPGHHGRTSWWHQANDLITKSITPSMKSVMAKHGWMKGKTIDVVRKTTMNHL